MNISNMKNRVAVFLTASLVSISFYVSADQSKKVDTMVKSAVTYKVLPEQSDVKWVGKKVTGTHHGVIQLKSGELKATV